LSAAAAGISLLQTMKMPSAKAKISGLTLIEVLVVIGVIAVLAAILLPTNPRGRQNPKEVNCLNNLKQIDTSFVVFADENQGRFPMQIPVANGGTMEFIYSEHSFPHFQKIKEYIRDPRLLICPFETNRLAAVSFEALNDLNISFFLNADASANNPSHTILAGDRFLQVNGQPIQPGLYVLTTNSNVSWMPNFHVRRGNLAFADGHVELTINPLNSFIQNQPLATNRLCVP
jgi:prepilin-type N-terminal cleavage/methylation domain-containing protein/prepilin-type processing-associated H-X9-DG protein